MPLLLGTFGAAVLIVVAVFVGVLTAFSTDHRDGGFLCQAAPGRAATADIPPAYLALYIHSGARYAIPWQVLAAIGQAESDHGRGHGPGIRSGTNHAGAAGPMQFLSPTWKAYGLDGNGDGKTNIYDPADAIPAAAAYLHHNGAPRHLQHAIFNYNHAQLYVKKVLRLADTYAHSGGAATCTELVLTGTGRAAVAVQAALHWIGTPYSWGGGSLNGPSTGIGRGANTVGFDCSALTRYAWHQAGIDLPRIAEDQWRAFPHVPSGHQQPGDLAFFKGALGSPTRPGHVGLVIGGGRMVEAPGTGLQVRISEIRTRSDLIGYAHPVIR